MRDAARLGSWLKTIASNVAVDHVRRQQATAPLDAARDTPAPGPTHDEVVVAREEAQVLHRRLGVLRDVDRRALWQREGHGVPIGEVADELDMTSGSVRVMLTRARQRVRDGYGVLAVPVVGLVDRWHNRLAGLGDAVPVAVAAPAVVVAVVAGVALPALDPAAPVTPETSVAVAPGTPTPVTPAEDPDRVTAPRTAPGVDLGSESAGFSDEAPTDADPDAEAPAPAGPVESLEIYLGDTGVGELDQDCAFCG